jgi:hypothetical protein
MAAGSDPAYKDGMEDKYGIVPPVKINVVAPQPLDRESPAIAKGAVSGTAKKHPLAQHEHPDAHDNKAHRIDIRHEAGQVVAPRESRKRERGNQQRSHLPGAKSK